MFRLKQYIKMLLQNVLLPLVYRCFCRRPIRKGSVIFADAHHAEMPFAMRRMYDTICTMEQISKQENKAGTVSEVQVFVQDFNQLSFGAMLLFLLSFMKDYATAEYVFICDYFLPVASCQKRSETKVVQLWHSCGLMKKIAFDAGEDIPQNYKGNMFGNYSYLTLSAEICVDVHASALRLPKERIFATGVSRTDHYFDRDWNQHCREQFFKAYPEAVGKKIALWAPTFRGNAAMPTLEGLEAMQKAAEQLSDQWYFVIKAHPHIDAHGQVSNCQIPTEELLAAADVLITDYSSVLFDYLIYQKAAVLFAPDLNQYEQQRGFYLDYRDIPFPLVEDEAKLTQTIEQAIPWCQAHSTELETFRKTYVGACDGHATDRILHLIGLSGKNCESAGT